MPDLLPASTNVDRLLVVIDNIDIIRLGEKVNNNNSHSMKDKTPDDLARDLHSAEEASERMTEPCVITDRSGYILLWYLPGLVSDPNQVSIFEFGNRS